MIKKAKDSLANKHIPLPVKPEKLKALVKCTDKQLTEYKNAHEKIPSSDNLDLGKLNILVAEDNRMNQEYVSIVMEDLGFNCTIAVNGRDAVNKVKENTFDLILMDIQMPEMDGYEATCIIRNELKNNIPIIALTANAANKEYEKCLRAGMNGYVSKPFKPRDLYEKIGELLSKILVFSNNRNQPKTMKTNESIKNIFDISILKKQMNGKMEKVTELLKIFIADAPREIEALEEAIKKAAFPLIKNISHSLVSSFSIIGVEPGVRILKAIEHNAEHRKETTVIKNLFDELIIVTNKIKREIANSISLN